MDGTFVWHVEERPISMVWPAVEPQRVKHSIATNRNMEEHLLVDFEIAMYRIASSGKYGFWNALLNRTERFTIWILRRSLESRSPGEALLITKFPFRCALGVSASASFSPPHSTPNRLQMARAAWVGVHFPWWTYYSLQ